MDQRPLLPIETIAGIGHNQTSAAVNAAASLKLHLASTYRDLVLRFDALEHGCARVPDPIYSEEDARLVTDFIAQCQAHLHQAEAAHKIEKKIFLEGGRTVDGFFKRRCEKLSEALISVLSRLKAFRDQWQVEMTARHHELMEAASREAARASQYHAEAQQRSAVGSESDHRRAAQLGVLADASAESAEAMIREAAACLEPVRLQGDYGATAYVTHSWNFELVDIDKVPRCYLSLNSEKVRAAIIKDGLRDIAGLNIFQTESLRVRGLA
jgi:hypothetical protein